MFLLRPGTPVKEIDNYEENEEIRYYISQSSSSDNLEDEIDQEDANLIYAMGNGVANCNGNHNQVLQTKKQKCVLAL